jgi:hypothetical protein
MKSITAIVVLCLSVSAARADERDPDTALVLTAGGTAVAVGIAIPAGSLHMKDWQVGVPLLAAIEVVPSVGHFYGGDYVSLGLAARVVGGGLLVLGLADPFHHDSFEITTTPAQILGMSGVALTIGGVIWDFATASSAARRYNKQHVDLLPTSLATAHGSVAGVALGGQF